MHSDDNISRLGRDVPLPSEMQGKWIDAEDASSEVEISGGEVTCFGQVVDHDYKEIVAADGALTVSLKVNDLTQEDSFQQTNITGLVISPEGSFHVYNVKFAMTLVRPGS